MITRVFWCRFVPFCGISAPTAETALFLCIHDSSFLCFGFYPVDRVRRRGGAGFRLSISFIRYFNTSAAGLVPGKQKIHRIGKRNVPVPENLFFVKEKHDSWSAALFLCFCCRYLLYFLCCITVEKRFSAGIFRIAVLQNGDHNRIISISQIVILRRVYYIVFCHLK